MKSRFVGASLLGLGLLLGTPTVALAHAGFVSSSPEPGSEVGSAPGVVLLSFSEPLNARLSRSSVVTPDGRRVVGRVTGAEQITIDLTTNMRGIYLVSWTTVSLVDGHTLTGSFEFGVGVPVGAKGAATTGSSPRPADLAIAALRVVEDVGLLLAIGLLLLGRLARRDPSMPWLHSRATLPLTVSFVSGLGVVIGEATRAAGKVSVGPIVSYLTTGVPGVARLARPLFELAALGLARRRSRYVAIPVTATVLALSAAGHAAAVDPPAWGIAVESVHLITAGLWAGGIFALALQRPDGGWQGAEGRALLRRFTPIALVCFAVTINAGALRGVQEVGSFHELISSSYGTILLAKVALVAVMALLSSLAWQRVAVSPRLEAGLAVGVIGAAALLAAFPLPPARLAQAERGQAALSGASALPVPGDVTIADHAGQYLVGLTIRGQTHSLSIYLRGLGTEQEDGARHVTATIAGRDTPVEQCGPTCREVPTVVHEGEQVLVTVAGDGGGTARFQVPDLSAPSGAALLSRMMAEMHALSTYRLDETLTSGLAAIDASYSFKAPDAFEGRGGGSAQIWIGNTRYLRTEPNAQWQVETNGPSPSVPTFTWDTFQPFLDARVIGTDTVDGARTNVVAFFGQSGDLPIWFRLWIDDSGLVRRAEMRALGHFMDDRYFAFNQPLSIEPPAGVPGG